MDAAGSHHSKYMGLNDKADEAWADLTSSMIDPSTEMTINADLFAQGTTSDLATRTCMPSIRHLSPLEAADTLVCSQSTMNYTVW